VNKALNLLRNFALIGGTAEGINAGPNFRPSNYEERSIVAQAARLTFAQAPPVVPLKQPFSFARVERAKPNDRESTPMRVLIVEDEPNLGRQLRSTLEGAGYAVDLATDGEDGHYLGSTESYDAVILDLGLPEVDGLTVLDRWRKEGRKMPVLVLTARDSWSDKVAGLDAGADDYLAKPFQTEELIARLRALIRRSSGNSSSELIAGDIRLDTRSGKVTKSGEPVKLTAQEYKLLSYLMHHKGKVVSRTELIEHIYDQDFDRDSNTIEVFVTRIRKKLGADVITTIRGLGYSLEEPVEARTA